MGTTGSKVDESSTALDYYEVLGVSEDAAPEQIKVPPIWPFTKVNSYALSPRRKPITGYV